MDSLSVFEFLLLCLATFRVTRLIVFDTITAFLRRPFHDLIEETNENGEKETYIVVKGKGLQYWIGELLSCYWCVGVWVAFFLWLFNMVYPTLAAPFIIIFAITGVASIIEAYVSRLLH